MSILEIHIEIAVVTYAKSLKIEVTKMNLFGHRNWPDRVFWIVGGRPLLIEFKRPGCGPRRGQLAKIKKLKRLGYNVELCWEVEEGKRLIDAALVAARLSKEGCKVVAKPRVRRAVPRSRVRKNISLVSGVEGVEE